MNARLTMEAAWFGTIAKTKLERRQLALAKTDLKETTASQVETKIKAPRAMETSAKRILPPFLHSFVSYCSDERY